MIDELTTREPKMVDNLDTTLTKLRIVERSIFFVNTFSHCIPSENGNGPHVSRDFTNSKKQINTIGKEDKEPTPRYSFLELIKVHFRP